MTPTAARVIYPELPDPLTPGDLQQLFSPSFDERQWAPTVARTATSQMALLARRMGVEPTSSLDFPDRTLYRHSPGILKRLGVVPWGAGARALAQATMQKTAQARTDPADIINSAIDALIGHDFELPALATLRRLAGTAHSSVNSTQRNEVCGHFRPTQCTVFETLLVVDPQRRDHHSPSGL